MSAHPFGVEASRGMLRVAGEVDMAVAATLLDAILAAGFDGDATELVVDLSEVTFLDSTGISALLEAHNRLANSYIRLRITDPTPLVRRVLVLGGVSDHLGLSHLTAVD
jgi:anti-sigma B factor antagonist